MACSLCNTLKLDRVSHSVFSRVGLGQASHWVTTSPRLGFLQARVLWVGCHSFLQGIFPTQGSNPGLLHYRRLLYQLSHQGSPGILEWVAYPFSRGSSQLRNWTRISCIAGLSREALSNTSVPHREAKLASLSPYRQWREEEPGNPDSQLTFQHESALPLQLFRTWHQFWPD